MTLGYRAPVDLLDAIIEGMASFSIDKAGVKTG
jgi:hypothetical protein